MIEQALERELGSDEPDRRDEQLRIVAAQLSGSRCDSGGAELDEAESAVVDDEVFLIEHAVNEPVVVQGRQQLPQLAKPRSGVCVGEDRVRRDVDVAEAVRWDQRCAGSAQDEQRVVGGGRSRGHHGVGGDPGLRRKERHQRFVLDLSESAEPDGRTGLTEPDRAPHRRHERRVVGIAPVQLHDQFATIGCPSGHGEIAGILTVRDAQLSDVDLHVGQRESDVVEARPTGARSDRQVHDGRCARGRQQRCRDAQRRTRAEGNRSDRAEHDDDVAEPPGRPHEVR